MNKELIASHAHAVQTISDLKLKDIQVQIQIRLSGEHEAFEITIFGQENDNFSFSFYEFHKISDVRKRIAKLLVAMKSDSFEKLKALKDEFNA